MPIALGARRGAQLDCLVECDLARGQLVLQLRLACLGFRGSRSGGFRQLAQARGLAADVDQRALAVGELRREALELRVAEAGGGANGALRLAKALELGLELRHAPGLCAEIVTRALDLLELLARGVDRRPRLGQLGGGARQLVLVLARGGTRGRLGLADSLELRLQLCDTRGLGTEVVTRALDLRELLARHVDGRPRLGQLGGRARELLLVRAGGGACSGLGVAHALELRLQLLDARGLRSEIVTGALDLGELVSCGLDRRLRLGELPLALDRVGLEHGDPLLGVGRATGDVAGTLELGPRLGERRLGIAELRGQVTGRILTCRLGAREARTEIVELPPARLLRLRLRRLELGEPPLGLGDSLIRLRARSLLRRAQLLELLALPLAGSYELGLQLDDPLARVRRLVRRRTRRGQLRLQPLELRRAFRAGRCDLGLELCDLRTDTRRLVRRRTRLGQLNLQPLELRRGFRAGRCELGLDLPRPGHHTRRLVRRRTRLGQLRLQPLELRRAIRASRCEPRPRAP